MSEQEPSMRVTSRDVYTIVMDLKSQLEKLNQNLPTTAQRLEEHEKETKEQFEDFENRLRVVEKRMWQILGIAGFIAAGMPVIVRFIGV
tara:strand:+ start:240 stop:506 length:267 start_codon:yes stop_codon:yes gene_type:complete